MINEEASIEQDARKGEDEPQSGNVSRRDILKVTWAGLGALASVEIGGLALAYTQPRLVEGEYGSLINVGEVDDFPPGSVTYVPSGRFYLSRLQDGGFLAIYQRCTHLGCNAPWVQEQNAFVCPCHNSQFTPEGDVLNPPAPRPLDLFPITIESGSVIVNTGSHITREAYDVSQAVYA